MPKKFNRTFVIIHETIHVLVFESIITSCIAYLCYAIFFLDTNI